MSRSSQRSTIKDMTNGNPAKLILGFAVPMLMGLLFQQFYSMVDTIIVGNFLGVDALASVGSTSAIKFMINGYLQASRRPTCTIRWRASSVRSATPKRRSIS